MVKDLLLDKAREALVQRYIDCRVESENESHLHPDIQTNYCKHCGRRLIYDYQFKEPQRTNFINYQKAFDHFRMLVTLHANLRTELEARA